MAEKRKNEPDKPPTWREFTQNTTFHGVKYIFDDASMLRRMFWLAIVLGAIIFFVVQVSLRITEYYRYTTVISVKRTLVNEVDFPAVTFCNLNQYRISQAHDIGLYECLNQIFQGKDALQDNSCQNFEAVRFNLTDIIENLGHQMRQLIDNCWWKGKPCNFTSDFKTQHTDIGLCFTFNFDPKTQMTTNITGSEGGLQLLLNIERYEHMRGSNMDNGVKFLMHDPKERPMLKDAGFIAKPGDHTFVSITQSKTHSLPSPYGECNEGGDSIQMCKRKCFQDEFFKVCGCLDAHMEQDENKPMCTLKQKLHCRCNRRGNSEEEDCQTNCATLCKAPCHSIDYRPTLTSSELSKINLDTFALLGDGEKKITKDTFQKAEEIQLQKGSQWLIIQSAAEDTINYLRKINNIVGGYDFRKGISIQQYLPQLADSISADIKIAFNPYQLRAAQEAFTCTLENEHEATFELASVLVVAIQTGYQAVQNDPSRCLDQLEWTVEFIEDCADDYVNTGTLVDECLLDDENAKEILMNSCEGKEKAECSCKIASCINDKASAGLKYVTNLGEIYKSNLQIFTGTSNFDAAKLAEIGDHHSCLNRIKDIQSFVPNLLSTLVNITKPLRDIPSSNYTFVDFVQESYPAVSDFVPEVFNIKAKLSMGKNDPHILNPCCWPLWHTIETVDPRYGYSNYRQAAEEKFAEAVSKRDSIQVEILSKNAELIADDDMEVAYKAMEDVIKNIEYFSQGNLTAHQLAMVLEDQIIDRLQRKLISKGEEFIGWLTKTVYSLQSIEANFDDYINILHNEMILPLIREENINASTTLEFIRRNSVQLTANLTPECTTVNAKSLPQNQEMQIFAKSICSIRQVIAEDFSALTSDLQTFDFQLTSILSMMRSFGQNTRMNGQFYVDNILQVDLYYEQLQYEKIEEQPSFVLGSLFSEVGGFLGLLLGASVMTVCELVDYLILLWGKRKREEQSVKPFTADN